MAANHFPDLADALSNMHSKGKPAFTRRVAAVAQQIGGAAVDLHRRNDPGEPPALVLYGTVNQRQRKTLAPARLVPDILQIEIIGETPARRSIAGSEKAAHPALGKKIDPTVPGGRNVDQ